jgi:hypothetical protein
MVGYFPARDQSINFTSNHLYQPVAKNINPMVDRKLVRSHAKPVAALRINLRFDRVTWFLPEFRKALGPHTNQGVIIGRRNEQWRSIFGNCRLSARPKVW